MVESKSFLNLPSLDMSTVMDTTANRTVSMSDLIARPQESFVLAEEKNTVNGEELHKVFLDIYRESTSQTSLCPEIEKYSGASRETGLMLKELSRQLENAGRETADIRSLSSDILAEASTWQLLRDIMRNKDNEDIGGDEESGNIYSELLNSESIFSKNEELRHLTAVLAWLESEQIQNCETNHYANIINPQNTFHKVQLGRQSIDLNPDVCANDLHVLDQQAMTKFNAEVYKLIRAGQSEQASQRCLQSGQSWKAAMMEGAKFYHYPAILDMEGDVEGSEARDIWKLAAYSFSSAPSLPLHERGIIGAVCGNSEPLLQLAKSWEDRVWALLKAALDVSVEVEVRANVLGSNEDLPASYWKQKQPIESLLHRAGATSSDRQKTIYRKIQELLILDNFEELGRVMDSMEAENKHQARFLAHLAIVLHHAGISSISLECVKNYADLIANEVNPDENAREDASLVAAYCYMLDQENCASIYSKLLVNLSCMNQAHQNFMIDLAKQHGLNVSGITRMAVMELQQSQSHDSDLNALDLLIANKELSSSLEVACEIVRNMIVMYREAEARAAVERLIECGAEELINNEAFLAIKSHLEAMEIFNKWNKLEQTRLSYKAALSIDPSLSFVKRVQLERENEVRLTDELNWKNELKSLAAEMKKKVAFILTTNSKWFDDKAKSVCIPLLAISNIRVLLGSKMFHECLEVVNLIGSEKHQLYTALNTQTAQNIIDLAAEATARILENGEKI